MTEEIQTPPPLQVVDGTAKEQVGAGVRDVTLILAAVPMLVALIGKRDLIGLITWLSSVDGAPVLGVIVAAGVFAWRQVRTRWDKRKIITLATHVDDSVAQVVQK
jgi:hypothetical protein